MIPTQDLPLLEPLRDIPVIGKPLADLLQPDLTVLVNSGYNPNGYADVATPAELLPGFGVIGSLEELLRPLLNDLGVYLPGYPDVPSPDFNLLTILQQLATGAYQGINDALVDLGLLPESAASTTYPAVNSVDAIAAVAPEASPAAEMAASHDPSALAALLDPSDLAGSTAWASPALDLVNLLG